MLIANMKSLEQYSLLITKEVETEEVVHQFDEEFLFEKLVAFRKHLAEVMCIPACRIFRDASLREMARKLPKDLLSLSLITGIGKLSVKRYGAMFVAVIRQHMSDQMLLELREVFEESLR